jgi:hypothetical protein
MPYGQASSVISLYLNFLWGLARTMKADCFVPVNEVPHAPVEVPHAPEKVPHAPEKVPHAPVEVPHAPVEVPHAPVEVSGTSVRDAKKKRFLFVGESGSAKRKIVIKRHVYQLLSPPVSLSKASSLSPISRL